MPWSRRSTSPTRLEASEAQYTQARAQLRYQRADFFPTIKWVETVECTRPIDHH